jgi:predicted ArsR family transcriptional regulator
MGKKKPKIEYRLDSRGIKDLSAEEIRAILRAADELIAAGGRSLLSKILKGSKDKKVLIIAT